MSEQRTFGFGPLLARARQVGAPTIARVLVVHAHPEPESYSSALCRRVAETLERVGRDVTVVDLYREGFDARLSEQERLAYETGSPILSPQVARYAELVRNTDALVFVYPTWWFGMPAILKGWHERVMVPGVSFVLDPSTNRVRPALQNVRRIGTVTTYGSSRLNVRLMCDGGRRAINRGARLCASTSCRTTWLGLYGMDRSSDQQRRAFLDQVSHTFGTW